MKKYASLIGILLVVAGTLLLFTAYLTKHTTNNILIGGLVLIIAGIVGYVQGVKHSEGY